MKLSSKNRRYLSFAFVGLLSISCLPKKSAYQDDAPRNKILDQVSSPLASAQNGDCQMTASPAQFAKNQDVILNIQASADVLSLQINGTALKLPMDQMTVKPSDTTEYFAMGLKEDGSLVKCSATTSLFGSSVDTNASQPSATTDPTVQPTALPDCVITADPMTVVAGSATTLKISAPQNAQSIILDNTAVANFGQKFVSPPSTQTYFGTYTSPQGSKSCKITVTVTAANSNVQNNNVSNNANRFYYRSCTASGSRTQVASCPVRCNSGNLLVDAIAVPEQNVKKFGGMCNWTRLEDGSNGVWCHGENKSQFSGTSALCTCSISCENFNLNGG